MEATILHSRVGIKGSRDFTLNCSGIKATVITGTRQLDCCLKLIKAAVFTLDYSHIVLTHPHTSKNKFLAVAQIENLYLNFKA